MDDLLAEFIDETGESLAQIEADLAAFAGGDADHAALDRVARALHTIKGACGFLALPRIEALAHAGESALARVREGRDDGEALGLLRHLAGHLKHLLTQLRAGNGEGGGDDRFLIAALASPAPDALDWAIELAKMRDQFLARASEALATAKAISPFQRLAAAASGPLAAPRAPVETAWKSLSLIVEDLSRSLSKPIALTLEGGDVEIDRAAIAPLRDALGHLARNCADHGLEPTEERRACGKPETGHLTLSAAREGAQIVVTLSDDGRGLDTARIRHRAITRGLVFAAAAARMTADEIHRFIFEPGFSTSDRVTRYSGRGIGLDVVRANVETLGGAIATASRPGAGTLFTLTFPAERAILAAQAGAAQAGAGATESDLGTANQPAPETAEASSAAPSSAAPASAAPASAAPASAAPASAAPASAALPRAEVRRA